VQQLNSRYSFLVDTGSVVSVLPNHSNFHPDHYSKIKLYAANGTEITTFGSKFLNLTFANKTYPWNFIIANVPKPIIGADFLSYFNLLVDCKNQKLINRINDTENYYINIAHIQTKSPIKQYIPRTKITTYCNSIYKHSTKSYTTAKTMHQDYTNIKTFNKTEMIHNINQENNTSNKKTTTHEKEITKTTHNIIHNTNITQTPLLTPEKKLIL